MNTYKLILFSALLSVGLISCSDEDESLPESQNAQLSVALIDAPGDYEEVNVDVIDVMVKITSDDPESKTSSEWQSLGNVEAGIYDLLSLTGGVSQMLAATEVPPGHLTDMRLVLGSNNTVKIDGSTYVLKTPSGQQSGLKLKVDQQLEAGEQYNYVMDFNAGKSVVSAGASGQYILKPVIRLFLEKETGAIAGKVTPADVQTLVTATSGETTYSTITNNNGEYKLQGLPEGTYTVEFTPDAESGFPTLTYNDIEVKTGETTKMDVVNLD